MIDKTLIQTLESVVKEDFVRLPYTEGINILQQAVKDGHKFEFPITGWGMDLASGTSATSWRSISSALSS